MASVWVLVTKMYDTEPVLQSKRMVGQGRYGCRSILYFKWILWIIISSFISFNILSTWEGCWLPRELYTFCFVYDLKRDFQFCDYCSIFNPFLFALTIFSGFGIITAHISTNFHILNELWHFSVGAIKSWQFFFSNLEEKLWKPCCFFGGSNDLDKRR